MTDNDTVIYGRISNAWRNARNHHYLPSRVLDTPSHENIHAALKEYAKRRLTELGWSRALEGFPQPWGPWQLHIHDIGHFLEVRLVAAQWAKSSGLSPDVLEFQRHNDPIRYTVTWNGCHSWTFQPHVPGHAALEEQLQPVALNRLGINLKGTTLFA
jgi:hypothetical protein